MPALAGGNLFLNISAYSMPVAMQTLNPCYFADAADAAAAALTVACLPSDAFAHTRLIDPRRCCLKKFSF